MPKRAKAGNLRRGNGRPDASSKVRWRSRESAARNTETSKDITKTQIRTQIASTPTPSPTALDPTHAPPPRSPPAAIYCCPPASAASRSPGYKNRDSNTESMAAQELEFHPIENPNAKYPAPWNSRAASHPRTPPALPLERNAFPNNEPGFFPAAREALPSAAP